MSHRFTPTADGQQVEVTLDKGPARVELYTTGPTEARRHVDLLVLTTDATYQPTGREKPDAAAGQAIFASNCTGWLIVSGMTPSATWDRSD